MNPSNSTWTAKYNFWIYPTSMQFDNPTTKPLKPPKVKILNSTPHLQIHSGTIISSPSLKEPFKSPKLSLKDKMFSSTAVMAGTGPLNFVLLLGCSSTPTTEPLLVSMHWFRKIGFGSAINLLSGWVKESTTPMANKNLQFFFNF